MPYVSRSLRRQEDPTLLRGGARFMGDLRLPGLLAVAFLRSPHAHARIVDIDTSEAQALPGVEAVVTGVQLATTTRPIRARLGGADYKETGWPPLARCKARFVGEPVVAVVASDRYQAEDALDAIVVSYDPLPAVADPEASMQASAPRIHEEHGDNVLLRAHFEKGDVEQALAGAPIRLRETFLHARCSSSPMEGRGVLASFDPLEGALTVWASSQ